VPARRLPTRCGWESDGGGEFSFEPAERAESGTDVTLHLREDEGDCSKGSG